MLTTEITRLLIQFIYYTTIKIFDANSQNSDKQLSLHDKRQSVHRLYIGANYITNVLLIVTFVNNANVSHHAPQ